MMNPNQFQAWPLNRSMPPGDVIPEIPYPDVIAAAEWLCRAFGFRERIRIGTHRVQLDVGAGSIVITDGVRNGSCGHRIMVRVGNVDSHAKRAAAAGALILTAPADQPFGERQYSVEDFAGQAWVFSQTIADVDPRSWGGEVAT